MSLSQRCRCPVCGNNFTTDLLDIPSMPVYCNVLWPSREQARVAKRGSMSLKYCETCGHVFNTLYDVNLMDYTPAYDNSLHFSPQFNQFAVTLAQRLVECHDLQEKTLVEIGCGKGDFLMQLCERGENVGWGFDRSFDPERVDETRRRQINFVQDFYTVEHARKLRPDFVCCRQVLEHLPDPRAFLGELRRGFGDRIEAALYLEVPNSLFTLKDMGIWDLIYEHCAYYTLSSLTHAVASSGFDVLAMGETFGGQFVFVEMKPGTGRVHAAVPEVHQTSSVGRYAGQFAERYRDKVQSWRERFQDFQRAARTPVIWGCGSKGVTFLTVFGTESGIDYAVDLNPYKHGKYVAGTGQRVVPPEFLRHIRPTDVIVMNPAYEKEIADSLQVLGVNACLSLV